MRLLKLKSGKMGTLILKRLPGNLGLYVQDFGFWISCQADGEEHGKLCRDWEDIKGHGG